LVKFINRYFIHSDLKLPENKGKEIEDTSHEK